MRRLLAALFLIGFLTYTGIYIFVYLFRSFRLEGSPETPTVQIWHGDPFARAILVSVLFLIGLVILLYLVQTTAGRGRGGNVRIRADLWDWLVRHGEVTNEPPERITERAVAAYRSRMEGPGA